jgi:hypothetical protein
VDEQRIFGFYETARRERGFEAGIEAAVQRILASPQFILRIERDPAQGVIHAVTDLELASRLSFFLWSSIPDDASLKLASEGSLKRPAVLDREIRRMLTDARSVAIVENFAGQWLRLRNVRNILPNSDLYPDFDENLRQSFRRETEMFFESIIREDRNVLDLLTADYSFINERLARHYGITGIYGSHFRRVTISDPARRGLLGQGSILAATSHAERTSPVLRGKWILENLLGTPPPPPPQNVPPLKENTAGNQAQSVRERLEEHRKNAACASCHRIMDPLGLALENFDAIGAHRTLSEAGTPIDASGELLDGTHLNGVADLKQALMNHPEDFVSTFTEKLMIYALGRGIESYDAPAIRKITRDAAHSDYSFSTVIMGIIKSAPFQMRRTQS